MAPVLGQEGGGGLRVCQQTWTVMQELPRRSRIQKTELQESMPFRGGGGDLIKKQTNANLFLGGGGLARSLSRAQRSMLPCGIVS